MEDAKLSVRNVNDAVSGEYYHDAFDDFPFYDSEDTISDSVESENDFIVSAFSTQKQIKEDGISSGLRRRRSFSNHKSTDGDSSELSRVGLEMNSKQLSIPGERKLTAFRDIEGHGKKLDCGNEDLSFVGVKNSLESGKGSGDVCDIDTNEEGSTVTDANVDVSNGDRNDESSSLTDANDGDLYLTEDDEAHSSFLLMLAGVSVRAIGFQITLLCKFLTFPVWSAYKFYRFVHDPFGFSKRVTKRIWEFAIKIVFPFMYELLKEHKGWWSLGLKCVWVFLRLWYVGAVLVGLLVSAFVIGSLLIRLVVEEPVRMKSNLNFDFREKNPVALVPMMPTHGLYVGEKPGFDEGSESRVIPPHHKLQVTVSLTLPESDYNKKLGIFQVRVDFLTAEGKTHTSSKRPCMLQYRSKPIQLLLTFIKAAPILTGYISETQNLKIQFRGLTESKTPTAFLRVVIEQRAEFLPAAGIPEIYAASVMLESKLPLLKRLIWSVNKILFIWISTTIFMVEVGFVLICCRPLIFPRMRPKRAARRGASLENHPRQS